MSLNIRQHFFYPIFQDTRRLISEFDSDKTLVLTANDKEFLWRARAQLQKAKSVAVPRRALPRPSGASPGHCHGPPFNIAHQPL